MSRTINEQPSMKTGLEQSHKPAYSPGLEGIIAGESALCLVDEGAAGLRYRGYAIADLAEQSSFEEVAYLLLYGRLPARPELDRFCSLLDSSRMLSGTVQRCLAPLPAGARR